MAMRTKTTLCQLVENLKDDKKQQTIVYDDQQREHAPRLEDLEQ